MKTLLKSSPPLHLRKITKGFSLIEVILALGLITFCFVTLLALLPIGIAVNRSSLLQTEATSIAAAIVADLRSPSGSNRRTPQYNFILPEEGEGRTAQLAPICLFFQGEGFPAGKIGEAATGSAKYRANVWFMPPGSVQMGPTQVRILITWPGQADPSPGGLPTRFTGSIDLVTAIN